MCSIGESFYEKCGEELISWQHRVGAQRYVGASSPRFGTSALQLGSSGLGGRDAVGYRRDRDVFVTLLTVRKAQCDVVLGNLTLPRFDV